MAEQIVQVRIPGARRAYGYTWDGLELSVGDWVSLPGNAVSPEGTEGRVEGFGADGYTGPMKAIVAAKEKQDPWMARMRQVRTKQDALKVYKRAVKAGITGERLAELVAVGKRMTAGHAADHYRQMRAEEGDRLASDDAVAHVAARVRPDGRDASTAPPPLTSAEDAAEHRARRAPDPTYDIPAQPSPDLPHDRGSTIGRVDGRTTSTENSTEHSNWGAWE